MSDSVPLISIGVSTFNRRELLRESLKSLLNQTFQDYEIIVVDDGSTDGTGDLVRAEFPQVRYFYKPNGGDASAKNLAAREAKGKYLLFNDSDDCFLPDAVARLYEPLKAHPDGCSYGQYRHLSADGRVSDAKLKMKRFPSGDILPELIDHIIVHSTACIRPRERFLSCGGYDETLRSCHDYKLELELALKCPYYAVQEPVFLRRRHPGNLSAGSYDNTLRLFTVVSDFAQRHPELSKSNRAHLARRLASLQLKLAREAAKEKRGAEVVREHLHASLKTHFTLAAFCRMLPAMVK